MTDKQHNDSEGEVHARDFTYYPLMNDVQCAFRIEGKRGTYHQCTKYARVGVQGYHFCARHGEIVRNAMRD